jgi:hypothetical protein
MALHSPSRARPRKARCADARQCIRKVQVAGQLPGDPSSKAYSFAHVPMLFRKVVMMLSRRRADACRGFDDRPFSSRIPSRPRTDH